MKEELNRDGENQLVANSALVLKGVSEANAGTYKCEIKTDKDEVLQLTYHLHIAKGINLNYE